MMPSNLLYISSFVFLRMSLKVQKPQNLTRAHSLPKDTSTNCPAQKYGQKMKVPSKKYPQPLLLERPTAQLAVRIINHDQIIVFEDQVDAQTGQNLLVFSLVDDPKARQELRLMVKLVGRREVAPANDIDI